jgi:hypothetical protein
MVGTSRGRTAGLPDAEDAKVSQKTQKDTGRRQRRISQKLSELKISKKILISKPSNYYK